MSFVRAYNPVLRFEDDKGHPLAGGWLYTYLAGTNIPVATAANESGSSMNPVQIRLDSRGECEAWLSNSLKYKFVVYNSDRTWSQTKDNVSVGVGGGGGGEWISIDSPDDSINVDPHIDPDTGALVYSLSTNIVEMTTDEVTEVINDFNY